MISGPPNSMPRIGGHDPQARRGWVLVDGWVNMLLVSLKTPWGSSEKVMNLGWKGSDLRGVR